MKKIVTYNVLGSFEVLLSTLLIRAVGNSLTAQWLGLQALTAKGPGSSIPAQRTRIPQATWYGQKT